MAALLAAVLGAFGIAQPANAAPGVATSETTLTVYKTPAIYGELLVATASVMVDGPANLSNKQVEFLIDDVVVGETVLLYAGNGMFTSLFPLMVSPNAGSHTLQARFPGVPAQDGMGGASSSTSAPQTFTIAQLPTSVAITAAPSTVPAFSTSNVSAIVSLPHSQLRGEATLYADSDVVATVPVTASGVIEFTGVVVPWGTTQLQVGFVDTVAGNFASAMSAPHPIAVSAIDTSTALTVSHTEIHAGQSVTASATVQADGAFDPDGSVEFLVDGVVVATVAIDRLADVNAADGAVSVDASLDVFVVGERAVSARYVPAGGFVASATADVLVQVLAVETTPPAQTPPAQPTLAATGMSDVTGVASLALGLMLLAAGLFAAARVRLKRDIERV